MTTAEAAITAMPSAPGRDRDTDENTIFGNPFGGHLSSDPVTARMVSDYVHGARTLDHIIVDRSDEVIELRPAPEAEQMSWYETQPPTGEALPDPTRLPGIGPKRLVVHAHHERQFRPDDRGASIMSGVEIGPSTGTSGRRSA